VARFLLKRGMTLHQFLKENREDLIRRTRVKVAARSSPPEQAGHLENGVPMFLSQLSAALVEQGTGGTTQSAHASHDAHPAIGESAALRGRDLLKLGFTIEQVVHEYGDVCQAITELAEERQATLSIPEFHTLNRCLDNAIAGAVSAWSEERDRTRQPEERDALHAKLGRLVEQATTTFEILLQGKVAIGGQTGGLLKRALVEMRALLGKAR
jgi:hypothetical protein